MNTAEKLRFLADRAEDGKKFIIQEYYGEFCFKNDKIIWTLLDNEKNTAISLNAILNYGVKIVPQWHFTEDEKAILRNLPDEVKYIARDESGRLYIYEEKPQKHSLAWSKGGSYDSLQIFQNIFQSIKWENEEACEFRRYI